MRQKDKKLKDLIMQVEDERKQGEQYKDQVPSVIILPLYLLLLAGLMLAARNQWSNVVRLVKFARFPTVSLPPGREVQYPHEAAQEAAGGVRGRVPESHGCTPETAAGAGRGHGDR